MKKYERIISAVKEQNPFLKMIQAGFKPEEIKKSVIEALEPYFDNKDVLEQFAIEVLVTESINLTKLQKDKWLLGMFEKCLATYHSAKRRDAGSCFESLALWQPQILQSISDYWSILYLEINKNTLEIEEFLHECLRNIGDIIEDLTKPYFKLMLHQIRIANRVQSTFKDMESLDLGNIVDELIRTSGYSDLFIPPPWGIRSNQWRNIAYHHKAKVENDKIICWYGKAPKTKEIRLSRSDLLEVVHTIFNTYQAIRLAHVLFFVDNLKEMDKFSLPIEVRYEAEFLNFSTALASQGFEITEYKNTISETKIVLRDMSDVDPNQRRLHALQFLFPVWLITKSKQVILEYREKNNTPNLLVSVDSGICEKIYDGELEVIALASIAKMVDLKSNRSIPTMPDGSKQSS